MCMIFFFSSRRRHTISKRDWSSDVCSSDLALAHQAYKTGKLDNLTDNQVDNLDFLEKFGYIELTPKETNKGIKTVRAISRSEERRVGKECRCELSMYQLIKIDVMIKICRKN